jgi:hypothetical protein
MTFDEKADLGSDMPILSIGVRRGSGNRLGLHAGGHRFDPGTLHLSAVPADEPPGLHFSLALHVDESDWLGDELVA